MSNKNKKKETKTRNTVIIISLVILFTPFIFISNLFPFMRFGMYAETVAKDKGVEVFELRNKETNQITTIEELPIPESILNDLLRNYYYKREIASCLKNIYSITQEPICIYKKVIIGSTEKTELISCYPNE